MSMRYQHPPAFTVIEVVATIGILLTGILGSFTAVTYALRGGTDSVNRTIATHLATEGLEIVRNIRDKNVINGQPFATSLADGTYLVFYGSPGLLEPTFSFVGMPPALDYNQATGLYGYDQSRWPSSGYTGSPSAFTRVVTIAAATDAGATYLRVTSRVSWQSNGVKQVVLDTHLYDWRQ